MCSAVIFWHCLFWHHHFSASIAREAIPTRSQVAVTQVRMSVLPDALDAAPRLVDLFVSGVTTTGSTICCLTYADVQVDSDNKKETPTDNLTEAHLVVSWIDRIWFGRIHQGGGRNEAQLEVYCHVGSDWSVALLTSVSCISYACSGPSSRKLAIKSDGLRKLTQTWS